MLTFSKLLAKTKKKDRAERERGRVKGASAEGKRAKEQRERLVLAHD
jgi:hypothetical protein